MSFAHDAHAGAARDDVDATLAALVAGEEGRVAGVALAVMRDDEIVFAGGAGCAEFQERSGAQTCARAFAADAAVRVASISKMVLALGLFTLVEEGRLDLNADASTYLGRPFRNPHYPDDRISVSSLLSHTASVRDPEEYWAAAPGSLWSLFQGEAAFASPAADGGSRAPGAYYKYANLNSGVLATVIERASGERFDRFMARRVLEPAGLDAGYNWSGVSGRRAAMARRFIVGIRTPAVGGRQWMRWRCG